MHGLQKFDLLWPLVRRSSFVVEILQHTSTFRKTQICKNSRLFGCITVQHPGLRYFNHHVQVPHKIQLFHVSLAVATNCACWQLLRSAQYRFNCVQLHCPAQRCTFSSRESQQQQRCWQQPWLWVTCVVHRGTSLLLWSEPASDEEKTCESVTHGRTHDSKAKRGPLKRNEEERAQWITEWATAGGELGVDSVFEELEFIRFKWKRWLSRLFGYCMLLMKREGINQVKVSH